MATAYLCLGSNKGDRIGFIQQAVSLLKVQPSLSVVTTSSFYETEPWGMQTDNWFVNAVVQISTTLHPTTLLAQCQKIESMLGRDRDIEGRYGDRNIDIDILFYDDKIISENFETDLADDTIKNMLIAKVDGKRVAINTPDDLYNL